MTIVVPFFVQRAQHLHHFLAMCRVEVAGRLVGENHRLVANDGARNGDTLLLTAGKLAGHVLGAVRDAHAVHRLGDTSFAFAGGQVVVEQRQLDVFRNV